MREEVLLYMLGLFSQNKQTCANRYNVLYGKTYKFWAISQNSGISTAGGHRSAQKFSKEDCYGIRMRRVLAPN